MRITCPNCGASYDVPESKLVGRKAVRCSRCGTDWMPIAPEYSELEDTPEGADPRRATEFNEDEDFSAREELEEEQEGRHPLARPDRLPSHFSAMERLARAAEPPPPSIWLRVAWGLSVVLVVLIIWSAFNWREDIMRIWPPSTRAYAALGLTQTPK